MAQPLTAKIVIVGDGACGKSSLLVKFALGDFPKEYEPTIFENYVAEVSIFGRSMRMAFAPLWDTAGQEEYERLRPLSYSGADSFLICFSIDTPDSLSNVKYKWLKEVREHLPEVPFVLVGCKKDLRTTESRLFLVTTEEGEALAESIGAYSYVECSALTGEGVMEVFRTATTCALGILIKKKEVKDVQKGCIIA
ncbi:hypothetical protein GALMADRAFT_223668 [Galerina marginata CBS 339.88]|uniref:Uncharacterized protein n=1 Tax=Galerina marginata (strain CBS 339.88) TaxID=685588 RepID=A0A067T8H4_GALM3|nr:hypothetical protein GALMADRAFT_223668 [Galerina marginata CBS 339.88]